MSKIKMVAADTFHATSVRAEPLREGDEFEVGTEAEAKDFEDRKLARLANAAERQEPARRASASPSRTASKR